MQIHTLFNWLSIKTFKKEHQQSCNSINNNNIKDGTNDDISRHSQRSRI